MSTDTTFFTNEPGATLLDRFKKTLKDTQYFDVLVGYFRTSGFSHLDSSLESIEKIRILVGLNVDNKTYEVIESARTQVDLDFESHSRTQRLFAESMVSEMDISEDSKDVEVGIKKFIEFLLADCPNKDDDITNGGNGKKLEFRAYPSKNIHAKVYISRFHAEDRDFGSVITGSSNFSESGLVANREFNVELKHKADVNFALNQFEQLWKDAVDISQEYVDTIQQKTWLNDEISPYHLYLKMLYEYLSEDINLDEEIEVDLPEGFLDLEYQRQAVISAKKILDAYNGVFLADVVGLGKTFIAALLAQQIPGRKLVICPPVLADYWHDTFFDFGIRKFKVESIGKLDKILKDGVDKFDYIFIDEAHRFRNEYTQGFEKLHEICFGKKVILVSATPLNNTFLDIYSQLKLFQIPKKSTIPGVPNLEKFFKKLMSKLKKYPKSDPRYIEAIKEGSNEIRLKILNYVMTRRTRSEIIKYFGEDMKKDGLFFPNLEDPRRITYLFDDHIDSIFNKTIEILKRFRYSRYMPVLYLEREVTEFEKQGQRNIGGFMKGVLVKRLESSFYAFRKTLDRFIVSYDKFINMFNDGTVYTSKKVNVYDLLDEDNEEKIMQLVDEDKVHKFDSKDFKPEFMDDLNADLALLGEIHELWLAVDSDPKLDAFINELTTNSELKDKKIIVFTESKETGDHLFKNLDTHFPAEVLFYSSHGGEYSDSVKAHTIARDLIKENFDPNQKTQRNDIRILITTDVLAEGINLHRSNIIVNYDLPWNPTRVLQRVGRTNRVGTKHKNIYIFNFFPTDQSDIHLGLEDNIKAKIQAFHDTLGEDSKYLTEDEVVASHELFGDALYKRLTSKKTYQGEEDEERSELEYLKIIRDIRDNQPELFNKIKRLPKKARSGKLATVEGDKLVTFFRKDKLKKFFLSGCDNSNEITFFDAVDYMQCDASTKRHNIPGEFYQLLDNNKAQFDLITSGVDIEPGSSKGGRSNESYVIKRLKVKDFKFHHGFTDDDEEYVQKVLSAYENGIIPQNTTKRIKKAIEKEINPLKVLGILRRNIPNSLFGHTSYGQTVDTTKREVILSEFLKCEEDI